MRTLSCRVVLYVLPGVRLHFALLGGFGGDYGIWNALHLKSSDPNNPIKIDGIVSYIYIYIYIYPERTKGLARADLQPSVLPIRVNGRLLVVGR